MVLSNREHILKESFQLILEVVNLHKILLRSDELRWREGNEKPLCGSDLRSCVAQFEKLSQILSYLCEPDALYSLQRGGGEPGLSREQWESRTSSRART